MVAEKAQQHHQNRPVVVHMDMDQAVDLDSSNDTGSFEKNEISPHYEERLSQSSKKRFLNIFSKKFEHIAWSFESNMSNI